jgi:hypothetical protein
MLVPRAGCCLRVIQSSRGLRGRIRYHQSRQAAATPSPRIETAASQGNPPDDVSDLTRSELESGVAVGVGQRGSGVEVAVRASLRSALVASPERLTAGVAVAVLGQSGLRGAAAVDEGVLLAVCRGVADEGVAAAVVLLAVCRGAGVEGVAATGVLLAVCLGVAGPPLPGPDGWYSQRTSIRSGAY